MTCIIAYDIESDRIRSRLSRYLQKKGIRLQKSVFAVDVERHVFRKVLKEIERIAGPDGNVAVFRLCAGCMQNALQSAKEEDNFHVY